MALVDRLEEAAMIPDLEGVSVEWFGAGDTAGSQPTLSAKQTEAIKAFWSEYFNRAKASLTFHSDVISGPRSQSSDTLFLPWPLTVASNL